MERKIIRIAIDLNEVLRDFLRNFAKKYKEGYNREYDIDSFEPFTYDASILFPFKTPRAYENFVYDRYSFELFGCAQATFDGLGSVFRDWCNKVTVELDEEPEISIVSPFEYGASIQSTFHFLTKIGCQCREVFFPKDSSEIWNRYDVVITANPLLLDLKPSDKLAIKIDEQYNKDAKCDYEFVSPRYFFEDTKHIISAINKFYDKEKK